MEVLHQRGEHNEQFHSRETFSQTRPSAHAKGVQSSGQKVRVLIVLIEESLGAKRFRIGKVAFVKVHCAVLGHYRGACGEASSSEGCLNFLLITGWHRNNQDGNQAARDYSYPKVSIVWSLNYDCIKKLAPLFPQREECARAAR